MFSFLRNLKWRGGVSADSRVFRRPAVLMQLRDLVTILPDESVIPGPELASLILEHHYRSSSEVVLNWGALLKDNMALLSTAHRLGMRVPQLGCRLQSIELEPPKSLIVSGEPTISVLMANRDFIKSRRPLASYCRSPDYFAVMAAKELAILFCAQVVSIKPCFKHDGVLIEFKPYDREFNTRLFKHRIDTLIDDLNAEGAVT